MGVAGSLFVRCRRPLRCARRAVPQQLAVAAPCDASLVPARAPSPPPLQRLRTELGLPTAVFCGGDFLYSFPQQFAAK